MASSSALSVSAGMRTGVVTTRPFFSRTSTSWFNGRLAAAITVAGMRTEALLHHFLAYARTTVSVVATDVATYLKGV